jgi:hypothetical protein
MRLPVRSETDAFWLVLACALVIGLSLLVGYLFGSLAGVLVFAAALLAALVLDHIAREPSRLLADAEQTGHHLSVHAQRLVLLVANAIPAADELRKELLDRPDGDRELVLEVLAPVLQSRTHFVTTDHRCRNCGSKAAPRSDTRMVRRTRH